MAEKVSLRTADGVNVVGDHYKGPSGSPAVLLLHMMPSVRKSWVEFAEKLNQAGFGALAIDLRGHGESEGGPDGWRNFSDSEHQKSIEDVKAGLEFQKKEGHGALSIAGASIGANLALEYLAESGEAIKTILLSPGLNYKGIETLPLAQMVKPERTVYVVAARDDTRSGGPADQMAREIYDALPCKKEIKIFEEGGHGTDILNAHPEIIDELTRWLKSA
ncbi:alpha/beta fold hydrolase [Patescibacteria group bacterium]|nr:alpha/beta fold hydrolase [Patescibacteria group bacterium]